MRTEKTQSYIYFFFGLSLPLRGVFIPGSSVVIIADVVFLALVAVCLNYNKWDKVSHDLSFRDFLFLALLIWSVISIVLAPVATDLNSIVREIFLLLLFLFFRLGPFKTREVTYTINGYILGCIATALLGFLGVVLLALFDIPNAWAYALKDYPYLDGWARAHGLSLGPNMLGSFLVVALILSFSNEHSFRFSNVVLWAVRVILVLGCTLALSRSMFVLVFAFLVSLFILLPSVVCRRSAIAIVFLVGFLVIFTSANLVIQFSHINSYIGEPIGQSMVSHGNPIFAHSFGGKFQVEVYQSVYLELKKAALEVFYRYPLFGVGDGKFYGYLVENSGNLGYPKSLSPYNPHSTYFGLLSETGFIGFIIFILFVCSILFYFECNRPPSLIHQKLFWISVLFLVYEGVNTDQLNFRHYIVFLALYLRSTAEPKVR